MRTNPPDTDRSYDGDAHDRAAAERRLGREAEEALTKLYGSLIYSKDDGGWYAALFRVDGVNVHTTELHFTKRGARLEAETWVHREADGLPLEFLP